MIKLVVFDLDGVLIRGSNNAFLKLYTKAMREAGASAVPPRRIATNFGETYREIIERSVRARDRNKIDSIYTNFIRMINSGEIFRHIKLVPGCRNMLRSLKRSGIRVALATGNERRFLKKYLMRMGLTGMFDCIVGGDDVTDGKPAPEMLRRIMKKLAAAPAQTVYVGDAPNDIIMGKRARVRTVAVLTGVLDRRAAAKLKPDYIIPTAVSIRQCL